MAAAGTVLGMASEVDMGITSYVRMVLWSFFGVRRRAAADRELPAVRPVVLALTAVGLAALLVLTLLGVVHVATS
ncbi:MAG TPA: DUF2970 domain-containing protein [Methylibium sp.]|nr:DUF2970 domain-containing protein [Methylibium sp.]